MAKSNKPNQPKPSKSRIFWFSIGGDDRAVLITVKGHCELYDLYNEQQKQHTKKKKQQH